MGKVSRLSPLAETEGLSQHEMVALVCVMQNSLIPSAAVSGYSIRDDMNNAGFTDIAVSLAPRALREKNMLLFKSAQNREGDEYPVYLMAPKGEQWLLNNQNKLVFRREDTGDAEENDIPF